MATFYTGVDKQRYDAGEKFLPMNQFLLNYTAPTTNTEEEVTESFGIPAAYNTNAGGGGALQAGDIITTGTPPGVGMGMKPQQFLKTGDTMKLSIENLGEQNSKVVAL